MLVRAFLGLGHQLLGEAWVQDENPAQGVLEMAISIGMLWQDVERRTVVVNRAKETCYVSSKSELERIFF